MLRFATVVAQFFSQLNDHLVQRPRRAVVIVAPDVVQQAVARKHFAGVRVKKLEQFKLPGGKFLGRLAALQLKGLGVNDGLANFE